MYRALALVSCTLALGCADAAERDPEVDSASALDGGTAGDAAAPLDARADAALPLDAARDAFAGRDASFDSDAAPRLSELVNTLFGPGCVIGRCHTTLAPAGELSLTGQRVSVHAALVNAPSSQARGRVRVVPFDPEASYIMEKLTRESPTAGTRMPPSDSALPAEQIARVRAWILAGAPDD